VTSSESSFERTSTSWRSEALLTTLLSIGSSLVYFYRPEIADERRVILALAAVGFFFAPLSERPLRLWIGLPALALVAWGGRFAAEGRGDLSLWVACSVVGAAVSVRAGGRAARYYLPEAESDTGLAMRATIRRALQGSVIAFALVFVWDGVRAPNAYARTAWIVLSAVLFLRFLLLQAKFLHIPAARLGASGLVPTQRWVFLCVVTAIGATRFPERLIPGGDAGALLITSMLLLVLAGLLFAMTLVRLEWPKSMVRKTSFVAGMGLAVALAAVVVELEAWGPARFTSFTTLCMFALLVLPFARATTKLFDPYPRASVLIGPPVLAVMMAPVSAVNGWRWELTSTGFYFAFAALMIVYHFVVATREGFGHRFYLAASMIVLAVIFASNGAAWGESGAAWKVFLIALGFVLYAVDLRDRARAMARKGP
jgi:hypothetical protein